MTDTVFRAPVESPKAEDSKPIVATLQAKPFSDVEPPYLDYQAKFRKPYTVEHYKLGDTWDSSIGGFPDEVGQIESYMREQIQTGEMANSVKAVRDKLKQIEKMTNMAHEERAVIKLGVISAYIKFLKSKDNIHKFIRKYGNP